MAYQAQVTNVKNQKSWAKKVPENGVVYDPKSKNYIFKNADGVVQATRDFNTAYSTAGIQEGTASNVTIANNQKFNLKGAAIQYDPKSKSYYFKDPSSGQILNTSNLATAYGILNPKPVTTPTGPKDTGETPEFGTRPSGSDPQFFQPVYNPTFKNYTQSGYSLMGDQSGLGALQAVLGQNTAGNAPIDLSAFQPRGIGQTVNPFSINPNSFRTAYQTSMAQAQPNLGQFGNLGQAGGLGQMNTPFSAMGQPTEPAQQTSTYGTMGGIGSLSSPFSTQGSQGAFGGGFGGTSLYSRGK